MVLYSSDRHLITFLHLSPFSCFSSKASNSWRALINSIWWTRRLFQQQADGHGKSTSMVSVFCGDWKGMEMKPTEKPPYNKQILMRSYRTNSSHCYIKIQKTVLAKWPLCRCNTRNENKNTSLFYIDSIYCTLTIQFSRNKQYIMTIISLDNKPVHPTALKMIHGCFWWQTYLGNRAACRKCQCNVVIQ